MNVKFFVSFEDITFKSLCDNTTAASKQGHCYVVCSEQDRVVLLSSALSPSLTLYWQY